MGWTILVHKLRLVIPHDKIDIARLRADVELAKANKEFSWLTHMGFKNLLGDSPLVLDFKEMFVDFGELEHRLQDVLRLYLLPGAVVMSEFVAADAEAPLRPFGSRVFALSADIPEQHWLCGFNYNGAVHEYWEKGYNNQHPLFAGKKIIAGPYAERP